MRVPAPVSTRSTITYSALFAALLTLSLGACQKKEETTPMPETAAPVAPVPDMTPAPSPAPEMPPPSTTETPTEPLPPADSSPSPTTTPPQ